MATSAPRYYTAEELGKLDKDQLATIAEARGVEVTGSGKDGGVLAADLTAAITGHQDRTGINPALEPEPEPEVLPEERTYKVVGTQRTVDTDPGGTFVATLPLDQEEALIWGGHIKRVKEKP